MIVFLVLFAVFITPAQAEFVIPPNDGFVTDTADVLTDQEEEKIEEQLRIYREQTSNEIALLIVPTLDGEAEAEVAVEVIRKWGIGDEVKNNGVLILHIYNQRRVYIGVGYGLEGALPDLAVDGILEKDMTPPFRDGEYYLGYTAMITAIEKHIGGEYTTDRYENTASNYSGGVFILLFFLQAIGAFLARSKSWWLGGILGGIIGIVLVFIMQWWLAVPICIVVGLVFDFIASKIGASPAGRSRMRNRTFGFGGSGRGGGGGFGGFGGGSSGGGGAGRSY